MHQAVTRPLAPGDRTDRVWSDGRKTAKVIAPLVKANDRLEAIERLEIYNRMYWYRILDCVADDCPGLRAFLGDEKFWKLANAYLATYPSKSYTLRNLCSRLPKFIAERPELTAPFTKQALDLARFEWAQVVAFDDAALPRLTKKAIKAANPETLRVRLQPHLTLLHLSYAADEYVLAVKRGDVALRGEASQAVVQRREKKKTQKSGALKEEAIDVVVHRSDFSIYYKRLEPEAARLLEALGKGLPLPAACARAMRGSKLSEAEQAAKIQAWFSLWMRLGWLCPREN